MFLGLRGLGCWGLHVCRLFGLHGAQLILQSAWEWARKGELFALWLWHRLLSREAAGEQLIYHWILLCVGILSFSTVVWQGRGRTTIKAGRPGQNTTERGACVQDAIMVNAWVTTFAGLARFGKRPGVSVCLSLCPSLLWADRLASFWCGAQA